MFKYKSLFLISLLVFVVSIGQADEYQDLNTPNNNRMEVMMKVLQGITDGIASLDSTLSSTHDELHLKPSRKELEFMIGSNRIESETSLNSMLIVRFLPKIEALLDQFSSQMKTKLNGMTKGITNRMTTLESSFKIGEELVSQLSQKDNQSLIKANLMESDFSLNTISINNLLMEIKDVLDNSTSETETKLPEMTKEIQDIAERMTNLESILKSLQEGIVSKPSLNEMESLIESHLNISESSVNMMLVKEILPEIIVALETSPPGQLKRFYCTRKNYHQFFRDSCYFFSSNKANWTKAQDNCRQMGGNLVKITYEEEFKFLQSQIIGNTWIGLSDRETEGQFKWIADGSILATNTPQAWWYKGEPNNDNGREDCVHYWNKDGLYLWNDRVCNWNKKYICEMPALDI